MKRLVSGVFMDMLGPSSRARLTSRISFLSVLLCASCNAGSLGDEARPIEASPRAVEPSPAPAVTTSDEPAPPVTASDEPAPRDASTGTDEPREQRTPPPTTATAGAASCRLGEPRELAVVERQSTKVAVAFRGAVGLAAWASSADTLSARPLDAEARPTGEAAQVTFRKAGGLERLGPVPQGFIALSTGQLCDRYGQACFQAVGLGPDGRALGEASLSPPAGQWPTLSSVTAAPDAIWAAHSTRFDYGLVRYSVAADGSTRAEAAEGFALDSAPSGDVPIRAIATSEAGEAFALCDYYNTDAPPPRRTSFFRSSTGALRPLQGFAVNPDGMTVDLFEVDGEELVVVFDRRITRLSLDGEVRVRPALVRDLAALPANLRDRVLVGVEARQGKAVLLRRDLLRRSVGEPAPIALTLRNGTAVASFAWTGERFVAVAAEPTEEGLRITSRTIDCAP